MNSESQMQSFKEELFVAYTIFFTQDELLLDIIFARYVIMVYVYTVEYFFPMDTIGINHLKIIFREHLHKVVL